MEGACSIMEIKEVLGDIKYEIVRRGKDTEVSSIEINSLNITEGSMFIAVVGNKEDGHKYIADACKKGAKYIVMNYAKKGVIEGLAYDDVTFILVKDTRLCLSRIANNFYGKPSESFKLIGVTGTNGKTSVTTMVHQVLLRLGYNVGLIGTIHDYVNNEIVNVNKTTATTPDCIELGKIMKIFKEKKVDIALMEVSSMALKNHRVDECKFDIVAFNNISPEHLDDHKTMDDYKKSKLLLFGMADKAIINLDDDFSGEVLKKCNGTTIKYGIKRKAECDVYADDIKYSTDKVEFNVFFNNDRELVSINTPSEFAIYNTLATISICIMAGIKFVDIVHMLEKDIPIEGRYDVVRTCDEFSAIVDYAHTPVACENILKAIRTNQAYKRIITVFGCGGDRDRSKRSVMGEVCQRLSDYVIITSDNPRTEEPRQIFEDILEGINKDNNNYKVVEDREKAINYAVQYAQYGDVIVILGKGHEKIQIMNGYTKKFDDKEVFCKAAKNHINSNV